MRKTLAVVVSSLAISLILGALLSVSADASER